MADRAAVEPAAVDPPAAEADPDVLARRLRFVLEADRLKSVLRRTRLVDGTRHENSAEHSWHLALMAVLLADTAAARVDLLRVLSMLLVHDVVEIDAGDTFCYDADANLDKEERERLAADRLFGLLPDSEAEQMRGLWEEFEAGETDDARFAVALDRLQPLLLNAAGGGGSWREHTVTRAQVLHRMEPIRHGAPALWGFVARTVDEACAAGHIAPDETDGPKS